MASYLLESTLCWLLFYGFYALTLSRETFFQLNRYYLLSTLALGALIPHLEVPMDWIVQTPEITFTAWLPLADDNTITVTAPASQTFDLKSFVMLVYWLGVAFTGLRFIIGMGQILRLYLKGRKTPCPGYTLIETNHTHLPFSFGRGLFISQQHSFYPDELEKIIQHELAHIRGKHTADVLLLELAGIFLWWSLPVYWYRRSLRTVHEYLADHAVLRTAGRKEYGHLLIRQTQTGMQPAIANHFFHSQLKKRILMMTKTKSGKSALLKYLVVFPLLVLAMLLFANREALAQVKITTQETPKAPAATTQPAATENVHIISEGPAEIVLPDSKGAPDPLFLLNGEEITREEVAKLDPNNIEAIEVLKGETALKLKGERGANGIIVITCKPDKSEKVDEGPRFPGCEGVEDWVNRGTCSRAKMAEFVVANLKYPKSAEAAQIEGLFIASMTINADGSIGEVEVDSKIACEACKEEVVRVIKMMPDWIPAQKDGKAVKAKVQLPVKFAQDRKPLELAFMSENGEEIFKVVEEMPRFPGAGCEEIADATARKQCADKAMLEFIYKGIKYPKAARDAGVEGTVVVTFVVTKDGAIEDAKIVREIGGGCGEEVLRLMGTMPHNWIPGKQRGRAVNVQFNLPIKFKLDSEAPVTTSPAPVNGQSRTLELAKFSASPNPASKQVRVYFETAAKPVTVRMVDGAQKVIFEQTVTAFDGVYDKTISLDRAPKGVVYILVSQEGAEPFTHKLVIQ